MGWEPRLAPDASAPPGPCFNERAEFYRVSAGFTTQTGIAIPVYYRVSSETLPNRWSLLIVLTLVLTNVWADDRSDELEALRQRIQAMTQRLNQVKSAHDSALQELRSHEARTSELVDDVHQSRVALTEVTQRLDVLDQTMSVERMQLDEHRQVLARQMRLTYGLARQDALKLIFNLEDLNAANRNLTYHVLAQRKRLASIATVSASLQRLRALETDAETTRAQLSAVNEERETALLALEQHRQERGELVAKLEAELASGTAELDQLRRNESKLAELLTGLREELADIPLPSVQAEQFAALKGNLPWPAPGPLLNQFGTPRSEGDLKWQGVLIGADKGSAVNAVSHGRVAFADWLRGFGLLLIVDHGDGYMSLYGRNQSLLKEVGEWVSAGEQIAIVGGSDASGPAALYFEIRFNGTPQNPGQWCAGSSLASG